MDAAPMGKVQALLILIKHRILVTILFTGFTGMIMTVGPWPAFSTTMLCFVILILGAGGAAMANNVLDQEIDSQMPRTQKRLKALESLGASRAAFLAATMLLGSVVIAFLTMNLYFQVSLWLAIFSYVIIYTLFLKRGGPFGTILGGLPGALPALMGSYAFSESFHSDVWLLFTFMMLWQPAHFWALALKMEPDYRSAGIPVLSVVYGPEYTKLFIYIYALPLLPVSLAIFHFGSYGIVYGISAIGLGIYYLLATVAGLKSPAGYGRAFAASLYYLVGIMLALNVDLISRYLSATL